MPSLVSTLSSALQPILVRLRTLVVRAAILDSDDTGKAQTLRVRFLGHERTVERLAAYGLASRPLPPDAAGEAEAVCSFPGGSSGSGLAIATEDRRHRPTGLQPGEVHLWDDQEQVVGIYRGGIIVDGLTSRIRAPSSEVLVDDGAIVLAVGSSSIRIEDGTITLTAAAINFEEPGP